MRPLGLLLAHAGYPDLGAVWASAADSGDPSTLPGQYGVVGAVVVALVSTLIWYVKRSEARWDAQVQREGARADRYEERFNHLQQEMAALLKSGADTQREVLAAVRDLNRGR